MAVLSDNERTALHADAMRRISRARQSTALTKAQWRTLINAADDWAEANSAAYNSSIPQPVRGIAAAQEKALVLALVILRRYEVT